MAPLPVNSKILGQLLLLQSSLQVAPNEQRLGEQVCHVLKKLPGILATALYIENDLIHHTLPSSESLPGWHMAPADVDALASGDEEERKETFHRSTIQTSKKVYGNFVFALSDHELFACYLPYIENTINLVALMIENLHQEAELRREKKFLQAVLDNIEDGVVACNHEGILTLFNRASREIHGLPEKPIPAGQWADHYDLFLADGITRMETEEIPLFRAFQGEFVKNREMVIAPRNKRKQTLVASAQPFFDSEKNISGAVASMHDITDRKIAEKALKEANDELEKKVAERTLELQQSNERLENEIAERRSVEGRLRQAHKMEAIGTLAGGIAHDFNNLLSVILGYTEMAKDDIPDHDPTTQLLDEVITAGKRARKLVKQILSFSRKESQKRVPVQFHAIVSEALALLRALIPTTIELHEKIDPASGTILADPTELQQIVINLCTNAAQAMDETGGALEVSLDCRAFTARELGAGEKQGEYLRLRVRDNGVGIDPRLQERIFDPYFTTKAVGKGSGMGLAVVAGIVRNHDGIIRVKSKAGEGAEFTIFFPRITDNNLEKAEVPQPLPTGTETILVVDDDPTVAELTKRRISRLGYHVTATIDSREALRLFRSRPAAFDLVVTDQSMPGLSGKELSVEILKIREDQPIVLCTGYSSSIDPEEAGRIGIKAFLMKPTGNAELANTIRAILDNTGTV